jgi:hypothetical protein
MVIDNSGNVYVLGTYDSATVSIGTFTLSNTVYPARMSFLTKISPSGTVLWAVNVAEGNPNPTSLAIDGAGNLYATGAFNLTSITIGTTTLLRAGTTSNDVYIAKYDPMGNVIWAKRFGGTSFDVPNAITVGQNGNICIAGWFYSPLINFGSYTLTKTAPYFSDFIAGFDSSGNFMWAHEIPKVNVQQMVTSVSGSIYLTGYLDTSAVVGPDTITSHGVEEVITAKVSPAGNIEWARAAGGTTSDRGFGITLDGCGRLFISGQMGTSPSTGYSINFGSAVLNQVPGGPEPMFIAQYDTMGNYVMSLGLISGGDDFSRVMTDNRGNLFLGGDLVHTMTFGPNTLTPSGDEALFVAKYRYDTAICSYTMPTLGIQAATHIMPSVNLYPNPATYECTISADAPFPAGSQASVYDMAGRLISSYDLNGSGTIIPVSQLSKGIYQCAITAPGMTPVIKKLAVLK